MGAGIQSLAPTFAPNPAIRATEAQTLTHSLQVLLLLTLIIAAAKIAGALAARIHQPAVFGEILVGVLLGPTAFNVVHVPDAIKGLQAELHGYRQLTDAYLLSLAHRRKGVIATFDRGVRTLAGRKFASAVEIVPTR